MIRRTLIVSLLLCDLLMAAGPPGVWLDVPFVRQEKDGCGAASIAMLMQYWQQQEKGGAGETVDAAEIQRALHSRRAHGIYASALESYLQQHGFRTFAFRGEWRDLSKHLELGRPLIVALTPASGEPHYLVVVGIDPVKALVLVNDPARRKLLKLDRASFEKQWTASANWTLLAVPQAGR